MINTLNVQILGASNAALLGRLKILYTTPRGTVPLNRPYGIDFSVVDRPPAQAKTMYTSEIVRATRRYEPEVREVNVRFEVANMGELHPIVEVKL